MAGGRCAQGAHRSPRGHCAVGAVLAGPFSTHSIRIRTRSSFWVLVQVSGSIGVWGLVQDDGWVGLVGGRSVGGCSLNPLANAGSERRRPNRSHYLLPAIDERPARRPQRRPSDRRAPIPTNTGAKASPSESASATPHRFRPGIGETSSAAARSKIEFSLSPTGLDAETACGPHRASRSR